jgi:hypothetical protein
VASSSGTVTTSSPTKGLYDPKAFLTHAALLRQAVAHCAKFLAAASRRSLGRVSVPVWLLGLSAQLPIVALVGRYPTNQLIGRTPLTKRIAPLLARHPQRPHAVLAAVSGGYPPLRGRSRTCSSPVRHCTPKGAVRLACVRHAASVYPEPGSNSPTTSRPHRYRRGWFRGCAGAGLYRAGPSLAPSRICAPHRTLTQPNAAFPHSVSAGSSSLLFCW